MSEEKLEIVKWNTICSDLIELYFVSLIENEKLIFTVKDANNKYEFIFESVVGPYMVCDEAFRSDDNPIMTPPGWTYIVKNSDFIKLFNKGIIDTFFPNETLTHYVIGTWDNCLEILSTKEPLIIKTPI